MSPGAVHFRIADTFTASLARLTGDERKAVKTTAFDLQLNPESPGMGLHKLARARDRRFASVRVSQDIRLIVHRTPESLLLCYVDHHDRAYAWAEQRRLETHPTTGAAQFVEIRERVEEVAVPSYLRPPQMPPPARPLFAHMPDEELLGFGVPPEWLAETKKATEDTVLNLADHLPAEAAEALLELATGGTPDRARVVPAHADPFEHPDARRRFRVVSDVEELAQALEYPWERWTVFLHPAQRELIERQFGGPARVAGSAGTGKTVVALHRAAHVARANADARVLLTTFSESLAGMLRAKLGRLLGTEPRVRERVDVDPLDAVARRLHARAAGPLAIASAEDVREIVQEAASAAGERRFSVSFLASEWNDVVDAWQLTSWEAYRDVARLGRKTRLREAQRRALWNIFERVRKGLMSRNLLTPADMYSQLAARLAADARPPYDFIVVDEAQDLSVPQLRFVAALGHDRPSALFFAGDLGQRIFQVPFSWKSVGIDIRGRSAILRINYRTSHQIRAQADRLLGKRLADVDGDVQDRAGTISVFNGAEPAIRVLDSRDEETAAVAHWLVERTAEGVTPGEMAIFVRSAAELPRARAAADAARLPVSLLDDDMKMMRDRVSIATMPSSKGLEFRAVAVMACDDEVIPLQARIAAVTDEADLPEVYETERHLLYVACTRARDHLFVTGVSPASEFLEDLRR